MSPSQQADDKERREILENDRKVREQPATMHGFAQSELAQPLGRFTNAEGRQHVVGSTPGPSYPTLPASSPWHGPDPVGLEPPLGSAIDAMPDPTGGSAVLPSPVATDDPANAPSGGPSLPPYGYVMSERAGSSSFEEETSE
jgi:hypothetical protein